MASKNSLVNNLHNSTPQTKRIGIFVYPGVEILDVGGPMEVFAFANLFLVRNGLITEPHYIIEVLAEKPGTVTTLSGLQIIATKAYKDVSADLDTLIIPGSNILIYQFHKDPFLKEWIITMSKRVRRLVSVCTGAFALAESGLLNGRNATTHWDFCQRFAQDYPQVNLKPDQIFIQDGNIFTSGGITSGIDLTLALLEKDWGHEAALFTARYLVVFLKRQGGQSQFSHYLTAEAANRPDIRSLQAWIMENLTADLRVETLAERLFMSPRNFARLFLSETGMTPAKYVEMARLDKARHALETTKLSIEAIAEQTGFADSERMRRAFIREIGVNPKDYRSRFNLHYANKDTSEFTAVDAVNDDIQRSLAYQYLSSAQINPS